MHGKGKKKKTDPVALASPFMRIPQMPVSVARYLIDAGYSDIFQLRGRSPESLLEEFRKIDFALTPENIVPALRLAVYFAENEGALDRSLLNLHAWES